MICLNSGGDLVRSQVEEARRTGRDGPWGEEDPRAFASLFVPHPSSHGMAFRIRATVFRERRGRRKSALQGTKSAKISVDESRRSQLRRTPMRAKRFARVFLNPTLRRAWPRDGPGAAICVQDVDVQCVLQFTLIHAAGCALHRHTSRVIHRFELSFQNFPTKALVVLARLGEKTSPPPRRSFV